METLTKILYKSFFDSLDYGYDLNDNIKLNLVNHILSLSRIGVGINYERHMSLIMLFVKEYSI